MASVALGRGGDVGGSDSMSPKVAMPSSNTASSDSSHGDPMDISTQQPSAPPSSTAVSTASGRRQQEAQQASKSDSAPNGSHQPNAGAAAVGQQPKVIQTAFIHKLYNMLEDQSISHLISWSSSDDSFLISPTAEFSRVLATYFKHTNISSFVRQLNMYGFHKVSDVFQTGAPDAPLWEFKHGNGSFKRGDLAGLKEIKRRASRHTLTNRETFPTSQKPPQVPIAPAAEYTADPLESRLHNLERHCFEAHARLTQAEEINVAMSQRYQTLTETLVRCYQHNQELSEMFLSLVPDAEHQVHRKAKNLQQEISHQMETLRSLETIPFQPPERRQSYASMSFENGAPMSPFSFAQDDHRRASLANANRSHQLRQPFPSRSAAASPHRYGSISNRGASPPHQLPLPSAFAPPAIPSQQHRPSVGDINSPLYLSRRHTSADIRANPGWQSAFSSSENLPLPSLNRSAHQSPYASANSSAQWPSSPRHLPHIASEDQQLQDSLGRYQIDSRNPSTASNATITQASHSQHPASVQGELAAAGGNASLTQPHGPDGTTNNNNTYGHSTPSQAGSQEAPNSNWNMPFSGGRIPFKDVFGGHSSSGPPTRRSSVAHLLNPAETAERDEEDDDVAPDDRAKRKRYA